MSRRKSRVSKTRRRKKSRRYKLSRRILRRKKNKTKRKNIKYNQKGGNNIMVYIRGPILNASFQMEDNKKIADIKMKIQKDHGINNTDQKLIHEGRPISDDTIEISNLADDGELMLMVIAPRSRDDSGDAVGATTEATAPTETTAQREAFGATTEATEEGPILQRDETLKINLIIMLPNGQTINFPYTRLDEYVRDIKRILKEKHGFNGLERLISAGIVLEDDKQISEYNTDPHIEQNDEIHLTARRGSDPLTIIMGQDGKNYVECCGILEEAEDIDKNYHCRPLIEKLQELILSRNNYNLYLSLGSNCLHYIGGGKYNRCMDGQVRLPRGWSEPGLINKVFIIDYGIDIEKYKDEVSKYGEADYEIFNMLWLDDAPELIETLKEFIEYNKTPKGETGILGKCLCINYVKFSINRNQNPIFENLIKLFNGVDNFGKNTFDKEYCINNRTLYLDHIYQTGTSTDVTLVEFNHSTPGPALHNRQKIPITDINSIDKSLSILPYYFEITTGSASESEPEIIF